MGHECPDCTFVADVETLFTFIVKRELKETATNKLEFIGKFTMTGWVGHSGFYIFKCFDCGDVCVDYPHGYRDNGCLYVRCDRCRYEIVFTPDRYKDVYEREKVVSPPTLWQELKYFWKNRPTRESPI